MEKRSKAFFINGGAGRVICSIPAFEKYVEESGDDDFIIVCEGGTELYKGHPDLDKRTFDIWHKHLFQEQIKTRDIVTLEPYRIWEYYNQKCNLSQAFDIEMNQKGLRNDLPKPSLYLSKDELLAGRKIISEVKEKLKKEKTLVFQPFGRGIDYIDQTLIDRSGRSFELSDVKKIIKKLQELGYAIIIMSEFKIDFSDAKLKDEVAMPEGLNLRQWAAAVKYTDYFLGCDSVGQHLSYAMEIPSTVVTGSTYPINISYPDCKYFDVMDMGELHREYSPIRITVDERVDRINENLMAMSDEIIDLVVKRINGQRED
jgi:ADP-heptose:LPS heptosyltransferase